MPLQINATIDYGRLMTPTDHTAATTGRRALPATSFAAALTLTLTLTLPGAGRAAIERAGSARR
jgi:hypothetical protein